MHLTRPTLAALLAVFVSPADAAPCEPMNLALPITAAAALQRMDSCNRDMLAAQRAVLGSVADARVAGQGPNPTLSLGAGSISPKAGIGAGSLWHKTLDSSVRVEQLIERGGKPKFRQAAADRLLAAARLDVDDTRRRQGQIVLQALLDVAVADARVKLLTDIDALQAQAQAANQRRVAAGDLPKLELQRQAIEAARAQADLQQARADAQRSQLALAGLLALEVPNAPLRVDPAVFELPPHQQAIDLALRPDVQAASARVEAARAARDLAQAQTKMDVTVGLQLDHWPTSPSNSVGTGNTLGLTLSMPLPVRHAFEGELARADNDLEAAQEALVRVRAEATAELARLDLDLDAAQGKAQLLQAQLAPLAEQVAQAAEFGHAKGALSLLDLIDARRTLRQTQLDLLAARADAARAALVRSRWTADSLEP